MKKRPPKISASVVLVVPEIGTPLAVDGSADLEEGVATAGDAEGVAGDGLGLAFGDGLGDTEGDGTCEGL